MGLINGIIEFDKTNILDAQVENLDTLLKSIHAEKWETILLPVGNCEKNVYSYKLKHKIIDQKTIEHILQDIIDNHFDALHDIILQLTEKDRNNDYEAIYSLNKENRSIDIQETRKVSSSRTIGQSSRGTK